MQYDPAEEFRLRGEVQHLTTDLAANGWMVISVSLQKLFLDRVRAQGPDWVDRVVAMEGRLAGTRAGARAELPEVEALAAHRGAGRHRG